MRRYDPFEELRRLQREMDRLFSDWGSENFLALPNPKRDHELMPAIAREPLTDIKETEKDITASIEMPGVDKKDIQLNVTEDGLEVKVEQKHESKEEKQDYIRMERGYRSFYRSLPFPAKVVPDKANAKYDKGVLEITIPKINQTKKKKLIEIK